MNPPHVTITISTWHKGNYRDFLQGDEVWLKKYFYVLRPVLACLWIERGYGVVPTQFQTLVERILDEGSVKAAVRDLIHRKKAGEELDRGPHIPAISSFLSHEVDRLSGLQAPPAGRASPARLDQVFRECLIDIYGDQDPSGSARRRPSVLTTVKPRAYFVCLIESTP